jgi:hypothetical protein
MLLAVIAVIARLPEHMASPEGALHALLTLSIVQFRDVGRWNAAQVAMRRNNCTVRCIGITL